jgi:DNA-binding NarL/FixJ family response regulator
MSMASLGRNLHEPMYVKHGICIFRRRRENPGVGGLWAMRILIVDDCETTRRILRVIARSRDWTVCGEAESGRSGIREFQRVKPDVVLIDLAMPDINGIEAAKRMSMLNPSVALILFTVLNAEGLEEAAQDAGISSIVSKAQAWDLIGAVETTAQRFREAASQRRVM